MARKKKVAEPLPVAPQMTRDPQLEQLRKEVELGTVEPMEREDLLDLIDLALDAQKNKKQVESLTIEITNAEEDASQARAGRDELEDRINELEKELFKKDEECAQFSDSNYKLESQLEELKIQGLTEELEKLKELDTFQNYETEANKTAIYPGKGNISGLMYAVLGLTGEAGEVAEKVKKLWRDKDGTLDQEFKTQITKELGDVLWYINAVAGECDITLSTVAKVNIQKLNDRKDRGVLNGPGDER